MKRPALTIEQAREIIKTSGKTIAAPIMLLAIRGYYKNRMGKPGENDRGIYDDAMFLIGPALFLAVNANTDPSRYKPGIAKLVPGLHYYKKGLHHIGKPNAYPAFRPDTPDESLPVTRDGMQGIFKGIAINIHRGALYGTSSEGCQTVCPDQWLSFQLTTYKAMTDAKMKRIAYLLVEG
jgi:lysozyme